MSATPEVNDALAAFQARDRVRAGEGVRAIVAANPPLGETWGALSRMAATIGEVNAAIEASGRHAALAPQDLTRQVQAAALIANFGRVRAALDLGEALLKRAPSDPALLHFIGTCRSQVGDLDGAAAALRQALAQHETSAATWMILAHLKTFAAGDPDIEKLEFLRPLVHDPENLASLLYALGKAYDDVGDTDRAFAAYDEGARAIRALRRYDAAAFSHGVSSTIRDQTGAFFAARASSACGSDRAIIVLGLPRSGTTLVEQILCAHSQVSDGAELSLFRLALMGLQRHDAAGIAAFEQALGADVWTRAGADYLHLLEQRFGPAGRIVDKTLGHAQLIGLIAHMLPKAPILWVRRDPGDVAWSCFRTRFAQGVDWSWSLTDIAARFRDEDRLHAHWIGVLGSRVLSVPYEGLTTEPEDWIPRILAHCGLSDEPGVRDFHRSDRPVLTASVAQVRRPISTSSVAGWRRYEKQLQPFFEAYQD